MPFFVEPDELVAGADAGVEACVVGLAAGLVVFEEFEPHAATPSAASARRPAATRRIVLDMLVVMFAPWCFSSAASVTHVFV
jgi:hypothetical protein